VRQLIAAAALLLVATSAAHAAPFACFPRTVTQQESGVMMTINTVVMDMARDLGTQLATGNAVALTAQDAFGKVQSRYFNYLNPACVGSSDPDCKPKRVGQHNQNQVPINPCNIADPSVHPYIELWSGNRVP
jgi:hypothetical protein